MTISVGMARVPAKTRDKIRAKKSGRTTTKKKEDEITLEYLIVSRYHHIGTKREHCTADPGQKQFRLVSPVLY